MMFLALLLGGGMVVLFLFGMPAFLPMLIFTVILLVASFALRAFLVRGGARRFAEL
jgi:hypothetical protein